MTAHRGITNHEMLDSLESFHKSMIEKGYEDRRSLRCALALTFALSGNYTREQAWEAADAIVGQREQQGDV